MVSQYAVTFRALVSELAWDKKALLAPFYEGQMGHIKDRAWPFSSTGYFNLSGYHSGNPVLDKYQKEEILGPETAILEDKF